MCNEEQKRKRMFEEQYNKNGCLMKIVEYNNAQNIVVQFQDKYLCKVRCEYSQFKDGRVSNPYFPSVYSHGMIGEKYKCKVDGKDSREYSTWHSMLSRCFDEKYLDSAEHQESDILHLFRWQHHFLLLRLTL